LAPGERLLAYLDLARDTPEVVIDLGTVDANIKRIAEMARSAGVGLRPHTKTHKLPQLARRQVEAGAVGVQVAKLGEAEVMIDGGIEDVLVGYPIVGELKLARLVSLARRARVSVSVDSFDVAEGISAAARAANLEMPLLLEIDTGLGRLGVQPGTPAVELAARIAALPAVRLAGVFTHEGHVYAAAGGADEKERLTRAACESAVQSAEEIRAKGIGAETVSVGSAGTFRFAIRCPGVTEVRPGTYVFNDRSQIAQGAATLADVAAVVVTTVVSRPERERLVVDAGSKVLTSDRMLIAESPASFGAVVGHDDWDVIRLSEEHGVLAVPRAADVEVGDRVVIVPNHICPVINLASEVTLVQNGAVAERVLVAARGMVQ
jgi:D-serine deaminase-like pyridoxal phosphate-dependent protein